MSWNASAYPVALCTSGFLKAASPSRFPLARGRLAGARLTWTSGSLVGLADRAVRKGKLKQLALRHDDMGTGKRPAVWRADRARDVSHGRAKAAGLIHPAVRCRGAPGASVEASQRESESSRALDALPGLVARLWARAVPADDFPGRAYVWRERAA